MGTHGKTKHKPATITPAAPPGWIHSGETTDPLGVLLGKAAASLPPDQPKTIHDLLYGSAEPDGPGVTVLAPGTDAPGALAADVSEPPPPKATTGADPAGDEALTPVPDLLPEGSAAGTPVLAGGEDLLGSAVTLMSYSSPGGPREVLLATVTEGAEAKLIEALGVSDQKMIPVQVQQEVTGRLPLDQTRQLHELVGKAAKSVNHKLKTGAAIPEQTIGYYQQAKTAVQEVLDDPQATSDEKTMAAHYASQLDVIADRIYGDPPPYGEGGKIPVTIPYLHTGTATVTKHVPAPADDLEPGQLPAVLRTASRIKASIDPATGTSTWDGIARSDAHGKEYVADMGGGWAAIYRPYAANDPAHTEYSMRGQLEIHAPQGAGRASELVTRLGQLNLVNRPLTAAEGEWIYLNANVHAQGLDKHQEVTAAIGAALAMEELQLQEIFHERQQQTAGLDTAALQNLARDWQLEAAARCLPKKTALVRDAIAHAAGYSDGQALATSSGYDPAPHQSGGWLTWTRFDVTGSTANIAKAWTGKSLVHHVTGHNLTDVLATGVLACTERRAVMGISTGLGMSEQADKNSGGAGSVFLRVKKNTAASGPALVWDNPTALMSRADYYGYNSDHFGSINPKGGDSTASMTRDPYKIAKFSGGSNEVMLRDGIDLLGTEAPSRILCGTAAAKAEVLALFKAQGITHLGGKPVTSIVQL